MRLPVAGQPLHTRSLTVILSQREDGRWQVRADIIDLRKQSFVPMSDDMQTAGIIHQMVIRAIVDPADRRLVELETEQPFVAFEVSEATRGECCRDPAGALQALVGRRFDDDFAGELLRVAGGARGCSHLLLLFQQVASVVPRALDLEEAQQRELGVARRPGERILRRAVFLDGFDTDEDYIRLAVSVADFHGRPTALVEERVDYIARHSEVRILAEVTLAGVRIEDLHAWERDRTRENLASAEWRDRTAEIADLTGRPIMPGLGRELRRTLGGREDARLLLDACVQLAPGFVQCTPALADRFFSKPAAVPGTGAEGGRKMPGFMAVGGASDSCYMWRADGPLLEIRPSAHLARGGDS